VAEGDVSGRRAGDRPGEDHVPLLGRGGRPHVGEAVAAVPDPDDDTGTHRLLDRAVVVVQGQGLGTQEDAVVGGDDTERIIHGAQAASAGQALAASTMPVCGQPATETACGREVASYGGVTRAGGVEWLPHTAKRGFTRDVPCAKPRFAWITWET